MAVRRSDAGFMVAARLLVKWGDCSQEVLIFTGNPSFKQMRASTPFEFLTSCLTSTMPLGTLLFIKL